MKLTPLKLTVPSLQILYCKQTTGAEVEQFDLCEKCAKENCNDRLRVQEGVAPRYLECANCGYTPREIVFELYQTHAPLRYDGFGTVTVSQDREGTGRLVGIQSSALDWQLERYGSGLYIAQPFHVGMLTESD